MDVQDVPDLEVAEWCEYAALSWESENKNSRGLLKSAVIDKTNLCGCGPALWICLDRTRQHRAFLPILLSSIMDIHRCSCVHPSFHALQTLIRPATFRYSFLTSSQTLTHLAVKGRASPSVRLKHTKTKPLFDVLLLNTNLLASIDCSWSLSLSQASQLKHSPHNPPSFAKLRLSTHLLTVHLPSSSAPQLCSGMTRWLTSIRTSSSSWL